MANYIPGTDSAACGTVTVTEDETGLLVDAENPSALGAALAGVQVDLNLRGCFTAAGRRRARTEFSIEPVAARCLALYGEVSGR